MRKYNKYKKKFKKRIIVHPIRITLLVLLIIIVMVIGYSQYNDILRIIGVANIKTFTITYNLNGGTNVQNPITSYDATTNAPLPIPTRNNFTFSGWYEDPYFAGDPITTTPTRI